MFRKSLPRAHPPEEPEGGMSEAEGLEFFASELGCTIGHGPHGETISGFDELPEARPTDDRRDESTGEPEEARACGLAGRGGLRRARNAEVGPKRSSSATRTRTRRR